MKVIRITGVGSLAHKVRRTHPDFKPGNLSTK